MVIIDTIVHRIFRVPYTLHVTNFRSPKKPRATVVLLHGIGNTSRSWDGLVPMLPDDFRIIAVDLLGFGRSPRPKRVKYNAKVQARSLIATLLKVGLGQRVVMVGHSLGSLVAVAAARRYPYLLKKLILCSPPFYDSSKRSLPSQDDVLVNIYRAAHRQPERLMSFLSLAARVGVANRTLDVSGDNIDSYVAALESSIINQTSLEDMKKIKVSTSILYGMLDPVVVRSHIGRLVKSRGNITSRRVIAGHEVIGRYTNAVADEVLEAVKS